MKRLLTKTDMVEGFDHLVDCLGVAYAVMCIDDFSDIKDRVIQWLNIDAEEATLVQDELNDFFEKTIE